jgi:hypothetical protein
MFRWLIRKVVMAIGWLALLKVVPWREVAKNAPVIAENAKKLWGAVARKTPKQEVEIPIEFASKDQEITWLKEKLNTLEVANADLHNQMLTSSELMKDLADQNTQLINRIELNRIRILRLVVVTIVIGIIAVYCLVKILLS